MKCRVRDYKLPKVKNQNTICIGVDNHNTEGDAVEDASEAKDNESDEDAYWG